MNIVFRTDASLIIGSGHVMRCLTLADALREKGHQVLFICRKYSGNLIDHILKKNFPVKELFFDDVELYDTQEYSNHYDRWLWVSPQQDADETILILKSAPVDWLIVDHYSLGFDWEKQLRTAVNQIMVIDDLANRKHDCDILLDQNLQIKPNRYKNLVPETCELLLGAEFVLLRSEFFKFREQCIRKKIKHLNHILVFMGGSDFNNITEKALNAILQSKFYGKVSVVFGKNSCYANYLEKLFSACAFISFYKNIQNISELIIQADLCIGAAGTASWERCYLGLPSIVIAVAENQMCTAQALESLGAARYLGNAEEISVNMITAAINDFIIDPAQLEKIAVVAREQVDGFGKTRILEKIMAYKNKSNLPIVFLRKAEQKDMEIIFNLRNHPDIRKNSFSSKELSLDHHSIWFLKTLQDSNKQILIASTLEKKVIGVIRFDYNNDCAEVSIYIDPGNHGKGYGSIVLEKGIQWVAKNNRCGTIIAKVMPDNIASHKLFLKTGFEKKKDYYEKIL